MPAIPLRQSNEAAESVRLLKSESLTMLVQRELERMILAGEIPVGAKLNEVALATGLGVSRGPVRESFRALEETGLVRIEKSRGVYVRELSVAEADDIYEIRATFDQMAGRKLARTITRRAARPVCASCWMPWTRPRGPATWSATTR